MKQQKIKPKSKYLLFSLIIFIIILFLIILSINLFEYRKDESILNSFQTEEDEIIFRLNNLLYSKGEVYDAKKIREVNKFEDSSLNISIEYPKTWLMNQSEENFANETIKYINMERDGYGITIFISNARADGQPGGGLIKWEDIKANYFIVKQNDDSKYYILIPKLKEPFNNPPYNTQHVTFILSEYDLKYFSYESPNDSISDSNILYNGQWSISLSLTSPKGLEILDEEIINEMYFILTNIDYELDK